jgi:ATP phosphoribosyltransferase regulatory subunit
MPRSTDLPRTAVPQGVASFFPALAARKRHLEARALSTFAAWGYREVVPPLFEYLDVLGQGLAPETVARGYKIEDRNDGRMMLLRPDVTAQVARMAAARREDPARPHRYGYAAAVFTHAEAHRGRPREVFQVGAELLGPGGVAADAEILSLMVTLLKDLGLTGFTLAVGHAGYFQAILESLGDDLGPALSADVRADLGTAMLRKDAPAVRDGLARAGVAPAACEAIARVPFLIGGREVLADARGLTDAPAAHAALDHLEAVAGELSAAGLDGHVLVDLGETRDLAYYTGVVFEVLVPDIGFALGGGGRYDDLVGRFGHPMDAVGFALDVERVLEAMTRAGTGLPAPRLHCVVEGPEAHRAAALLRARGLSVARALAGEDPSVPVLRAENGALARRTPKGLVPVDAEAFAREALQGAGR